MRLVVQGLARGTRVCMPRRWFASKLLGSDPDEQGREGPESGRSFPPPFDQVADILNAPHGDPPAQANRLGEASRLDALPPSGSSDRNGPAWPEKMRKPNKALSGEGRPLVCRIHENLRHRPCLGLLGRPGIDYSNNYWRQRFPDHVIENVENWERLDQYADICGGLPQITYRSSTCRQSFSCGGSPQLFQKYSALMDYEADGISTLDEQTGRMGTAYRPRGCGRPAALIGRAWARRQTPPKNS